MKKFLTFLLCFTVISGLISPSAYAAPEWPSGVDITAGGGIVIDADSGAVIFGKNIHDTFYPASITKILTALIVIERCDLDEIVTYSHNAVYNVEANSSSAGLDEGDQITVRDSLYAMMLQSANEAANALAEHTAGSIEGFAGLMNKKARELGCQDSNFCNPSGLNDDNHYTSPYDMAIIARTAFQNETFVEIDSTLAYDLPPTKRHAEGSTVWPKHKMLKKSQNEYYPGIIGGKTGYTIKAGNTLVTCAQRNDMKLITVILDGYQTHYTDTKTLLDFGFNNFISLRISDYETAYTDIDNDLTFAGLPAANLSVLSFSNNSRITLPANADFTDAQSAISFDMTAADPEDAVARIDYTYNERKVGSAYLMRWEDTVPVKSSETAVIDTSAAVSDAGSLSEEASAETPTSGTGETDDPLSPETPEPIDTTPFEIPPLAIKIAIAIVATGVLIAGIVVWRIQAAKKEAAARRLRFEKRRQRLKDIGISTDDFEQLLLQKRQRMGQASQPPFTDDSDDEYEL